MELVVFMLAIYRRPLFGLFGVLLAIAFIRDNPWLTALILALPKAVLSAWAAFKLGASKRTDDK